MKRPVNPFTGRAMTVSGHGILSTFIVVYVLLLVLIHGTGCTSSRQHFYMGQGADLASTYYALEIDGRFKEANPLAEGTAINRVVYMKAAMFLLTEGMVKLFPEHADMCYRIGGWVGYAAATWNTHLLLTK